LERIRWFAKKVVMGANEWPLLLAVRRGLIQVLPLIIAGSVALLLLNLPIPRMQPGLDSIFGQRWRDLCLLIQQGSYGIASLAALVCISLQYANDKSKDLSGYRLSPTITTVVSLSCYFVLAAPLDGPLIRGFFSFAGGFPIALTVALSATPLFIFLNRCSPCRRVFETVGTEPEVRDALAAIPSGAATILAFGLVRISLESLGLMNLHSQAQSLFGAPFSGAGSSLGTGVAYIALSQFFWFLGVHGPNLLFGVEDSILNVATQLNIQHAGSGLEPLNILTKPFVDAFVHIGGSGSTLALIVAIFLKSNSKNTRRLALVALVPAFFNVNEVLLFGLPLVLNPIYLIPFLLAPLLQTLVAYAAAAWGLVPLTVSGIHWTSPILVGGYAATDSVAGAVLQLICMGLGVLVYLPFVGLANEVYNHRFKNALTVLMDAASSAATNPSGKKCIGAPGQAGMVAEMLASDLTLALESKGQLYVVYQPQVDIDKCRVVGAEALLRWKHPVHGLIPPHVAVALAEDVGTIHELGMKVLKEACRQHASLLSRVEESPVLSVNMSAPQLEDDLIVDKVIQVLKQYNIAPSLLKLEVTESIALTPEAKTVETLRHLRDHGVLVAIDDFGMGHTSLRYIKEFPVDTIKIDRSLIQESAGGVNDHIVTSIITLCNALNIQIVIEGVESLDQLERFRAHGCCIYQGYLFSKPLDFDGLVDYFCEKSHFSLGAAWFNPASSQYPWRSDSLN
jgi:PTS system cellobiose-specific IIC component